MRWCWSENRVELAGAPVLEFSILNRREFAERAIEAAVRARGMTYRSEERSYPRLELSARHSTRDQVCPVGALPSRSASRHGLPLIRGTDRDEAIICDHAQEWWKAAEVDLGRRELLSDAPGRKA